MKLVPVSRAYDPRGRVEAAIVTAAFAQTYAVGWLSMMFPETKQVGSLLNAHLICRSRKVQVKGTKAKSES